MKWNESVHQGLRNWSEAPRNAQLSRHKKKGPSNKDCTKSMHWTDCLYSEEYKHDPDLDLTLSDVDKKLSKHGGKVGLLLTLVRTCQECDVSDKHSGSLEDASDSADYQKLCDKPPTWLQCPRS